MITSLLDHSSLQLNGSSFILKHEKRRLKIILKSYENLVPPTLNLWYEPLTCKSASACFKTLKKKFSLLRDFQLLGNIYFLFGSRKRQMELKTLGVDLVTPLYTHFMLDPPTHFLSKFVNVNDFVIIMLCTAACDNTIWNASSTSSLMGLLLSCNKQDAPTN